MRLNEEEVLTMGFLAERDEDKIPKTRDVFVWDEELDNKGESEWQFYRNR